MAFHVSTVETSAAPAVNVHTFIGSNTFHTSPVPKRSRNGKLPVDHVMLQKEASDPEFRKRMQTSRALLATDLYQEEGVPLSLAALRLKRGMSQHQLAALLNTSQPHIAKIEAGKVKVMLLTAKKLSCALGVTLDEISSVLAVTDPSLNEIRTLLGAAT